MSDTDPARSAEDVRCHAWFNFDLNCERGAEHDGQHWAYYMGPPPKFDKKLLMWDVGWTVEPPARNDG